jgi:hypothetical protein
MDTFLAAKDFSPQFTKHLGPPSMNWPPQTREQWRADLTSGFVGEMYIEWHIELQAYWEDTENRSAIGWFSEKGLFVEDQKYEQTYVMRYEFDENGKLLNLWELTDSYLQKTLAEKWMRRVAECWKYLCYANVPFCNYLE